MAHRYDRDDIARFLENHRDAVQAAASSPDASPEQADPAIPRPTAIAVHTSSAVATNEHEQNEVSVQSLTIVVVGENGSGSTELIHRYAFDSIPEKETACDLTPQASTSGCSDGISDGDSSRQSAFAKRVEKTVVQCHVSATSHRVQLEIWVRLWRVKKCALICVPMWFCLEVAPSRTTRFCHIFCRTYPALHLRNTLQDGTQYFEKHLR